MVFISWVELMQAEGTEAANSCSGIIPLIKNQAVRQVSLRGVKSRVPRGKQSPKLGDCWWDRPAQNSGIAGQIPPYPPLLKGGFCSPFSKGGYRGIYGDAYPHQKPLAMTVFGRS